MPVIVEDTVYYVDDRSQRIDLWKGNKYYFRNISWQGNAKCSEGRWIHSWRRPSDI